MSEAVAGVGGDALGAVDGGGVAEFDGVGDVVGGQGELVVVAQVLDVEGRRRGGRAWTGPAVAVLDPGGRAGAQRPVVAAGDDGVAGAGVVAVGQVDLAARVAGRARRAVRAALVELGDLVAGGGEHERVEPAARSACQAVRRSVVTVSGSPTWMRSWSR